jgi:hypothetical protein
VDKRLHDWLGALPDHYRQYRKPEGIWSMTTRRELCFCETYARDCFSGTGIIVDLGCWFGATTFCFARGLKQNTHAKQYRRIEAFDRFVWDERWQRVADAIGMRVEYRPGENFFPEVEKLLSPFQELVLLHPGDLLDYQSSAVPVEMLFIDAMKSWPVAEKIVEAFFPRLIPNLSVVVQQDFVYHAGGGAMNHLFMWRLRDYFEPIHYVPESASLAFLCTKPIDRTELPALSLDSFQLEEIESAYEYSLRLVPEERGQILLEAARLAFLIWRAYYEPALAHAERLANEGVKFSEETFSDTRALIRQCQSDANTRHDTGTTDILKRIDSSVMRLAPTSAVSDSGTVPGLSRRAARVGKLAFWKK